MTTNPKLHRVLRTVQVLDETFDECDETELSHRLVVELANSGHVAQSAYLVDGGANA